MLQLLKVIPQFSSLLIPVLYTLPSVTLALHIARTSETPSCSHGLLCSSTKIFPLTLIFAELAQLRSMTGANDTHEKGHFR